MTNIRRLMVGVAAAMAVLAGCDPYSKASTAPPAVVSVTATSGSGGDATKGTQASPGVWTIDGALTTCAGGAVSVEQPVIFVTFNKQMNPASVQTSVTDCTPTKGWLTVDAKDASGGALTLPTGTAWYSCYDPSSPTAAEGGSAIIFLGNAPSALSLTSTPATASAVCTDAVPAESGWGSAQAIDAAAVGITSAHITGSVSDKEGRSLPIDVTVNYAPNPGTVRNLTVSASDASTVTLKWTNRSCAASGDPVQDEIRTQDANGDYTVVVTAIAPTTNPVAYAPGDHEVVVTADPTTATSYAVITVTTVPATPPATTPSKFEQEQSTITNVAPGLPTPVAPTVALSAGDKLPLIVTTGDIPAGADDLDVYRASFTTAPGAFSRLGNVGTGKTSFIDVSSAANSRYVYKTVAVKSVAGVRARGADSPVSAPFVTGPADPGAGTPTATNDSVDVVWDFLPGTIASDTLTLALERAPDNAGQPGTFVPAGTATADADKEIITGTDTGLPADTTFWYRLSVTNGATVGGTVKSTPVSVTTLAFEAPTNVVGTRDATTKDVTVTWTASPGATGYTVERSLTAACGYTPIKTGQPGTSYTDPAAPANVAYKVVATAGAKSSPESAASPVVP